MKCFTKFCKTVRWKYLKSIVDDDKVHVNQFKLTKLVEFHYSFSEIKTR